MTRTLAASLLALLVAAAMTACGSFRPYPDAEPMARDPDDRPYSPPPEEYFSPFAWDGIDNSIFRPVSNFFAVDPGGEATNVNAVDEVPNSSWWTNRLGARPMTPAEMAEGPCTGAPAVTGGPWTVTGGKPNGENPGFFIEMADGQRYLLKFDGAAQAPRATAADVIGTRIYWAAGFFSPCNRIVEFDPSILVIADDATVDDEDGDEVPMTQAMIDGAFERALELPDGRYRGNASLYLPGKPLGPFKYDGVRDDDPNDVVPHEDRRELRAASILASWINHFDSREQNTLDMWIEVGEGEQKKGYVRHHYIDYGDSFGSLWEWDRLSRRWGHSYIFDVGYILSDWFTFGLIERPWDVADYGPTGETLAYYDSKPFDPDDWVNEYPNAAFSRRTERDAAWMTRILAGFTDAHIDALVETAHLTDAALVQELTKTLRERRDTILRRYLLELSPLTRPEVVAGAGGARVCFEDLAVTSGIVAAADRRYAARAWVTKGLRPAASEAHVEAPGRPCATLPAGTAGEATYLVVDVTGHGGGAEALPVRAHLYQDAAGYRVVGLERPDDDDAPE